MKLAKIASLLLLAVSCGIATSNAQDLSGFFKGVNGAFVLYDLKNNRYLRYNEQRCRERFSPKSTFKIPNSLIGLETGVIRDAEFVIPWNREKYPPQPDWNQEPFIHWGKDQTLRSAFKYSVVWYYRELALRVGADRMKKYVSAFNYGNKDVSGRVDNFWLDNTLKISADDQVEFLKALYTGRLPVAKRTTEIVKDILVFEKTPAYTLSAKTGGGPIAEGIYIGWFVGYLEAQGNVYFFAINIEGASFAGIRDKRIELTKQILTALGHLPSGKQGDAEAPEQVSFPTQDGGIVYANLYGKGERGVVLAHGGRFNKESWEKQAQELVKAGFRVLAIDFRGRGQSRGPAQTNPNDDGVRFDVLAAVRYLRKTGAKTVSVVGASFGGGAAAEASIVTEPGEIDRLVLLAHSPIDKPKLMKGRKLFILTRDDANAAGLRLPSIREQYEKAPGPKELVILEGSAHAQFIFETDQGERLMREVLRFLSEP